MEARINGVNKVTIASASFTNYYDKTEIDELLGAKQQLYLTQEEYNNLSDEEKLNDNVVFNITDAVTEYPTIEQVNALVSNKADIHHIHNDYATISYVNEAIANMEGGGITAIPDEYITNEELEAKNYVTNEVFNATIGDIDSILDFINGEII
jgi:hypothetical protein